MATAAKKIDFTLTEKFKKIEEELNKVFYERDEAVHLTTLAILSNTNLLLVGSPGTAKTYIMRGYAQHIKNGVTFYKTVTPFTNPEDIFGGYPMSSLENGTYIRNTEGKIAACDLGILDEIFKAGEGLLNSLLDIAHDDRQFTNGSKTEATPLLTILAASNELPVGNDTVQALYDRMHIMLEVDPIRDSSLFEKMLENPRKYQANPEIFVTPKEIQKAREEINKIHVSQEIRSIISTIRANLKALNVFASDRTYHLLIEVAKAEAWLDNRDEVVDKHLEIAQYMLWKDPAHRKNVFRGVMDTISPELVGLTEILSKCEEATNKVLSEGKATVSDISQAHTQLLAQVNKAKKIRKEMAHKGRDLRNVDKILEKLGVLQDRLATAGFGETGTIRADDIFK